MLFSTRSFQFARIEYLNWPGTNSIWPRSSVIVEDRQSIGHEAFRNSSISGSKLTKTQPRWLVIRWRGLKAQSVAVEGVAIRLLSPECL